MNTSKLKGHPEKWAKIQRIGLWIVGVPLAWLVTTSFYGWQKGWSDNTFLMVYLSVYVFAAVAAVFIRDSRSEWPAVTYWFTWVFGLLGMSRILWALVHTEHSTGAAHSYSATSLAMFLGTLSLYMFYRWEESKEPKPPQSPKRTGSKLRIKRRPASASQPMMDEAAWW